MYGRSSSHLLHWVPTESFFCGNSIQASISNETFSHEHFWYTQIEKLIEFTINEKLIVMYVFIYELNSSQDLTAALNYIGKTFRMISLSKGITELSEEQLIKLIESAPVKQRPQSERFTAVLRWTINSNQQYFIIQNQCTISSHHYIVFID